MEIIQLSQLTCPACRTQGSLYEWDVKTGNIFPDCAYGSQGIHRIQGPGNLENPEPMVLNEDVPGRSLDCRTCTFWFDREGHVRSEDLWHPKKSPQAALRAIHRQTVEEEHRALNAQRARVRIQEIAEAL